MIPVKLASDRLKCKTVFVVHEKSENYKIEKHFGGNLVRFYLKEEASGTKIYENLPVKKMFIQPAASDDGTSIGAAYYCWHNILNKKKRFFLKICANVRLKFLQPRCCPLRKDNKND